MKKDSKNNARKSKKEKGKKRSASLPFFDMYGQSPSFLIYGEDSYGTTFGCILSIVVVVLMLTITSFYTWRFLVKGEVKMSETSTSGTSFQTIDLKQAKFFLSINYRRVEKLEAFGDIEDKLLKIRVNLITKTNSDKKGTVPTITNEGLELQNCNEAYATATSEFEGEATALDENSRCVRFKADKVEISGGLGASSWTYLEIVVEPCAEGEATCTTGKLVTPGVSYNGGGADAAEDSAFKDAFDEFQELNLHFNLMSASSDLNNFTNPISYNINTDHALKIDMFNKKSIDFYLGKYEVVTKYGWLYPFQTSVTSTSLVQTFMDSTHRDVTSKNYNFVDGDDNDQTSTQPYMVMRVMSSTISTSIEREYETLIDVFGNVGGVGEAITFIIAIILYCHSDVRYEQRILNDGLLQEIKDQKEGEANKGSIDENHEESQNFGLQPARTKTVTMIDYDEQGEEQEITKVYELDKKRVRYGYMELFRFKYCCGCCNRKETHRQEEYERDLETVHRIVDIRNMIKNGANLNVLTNVFLKDYQIKLIPHLNTHKNDEAIKAKDLTNKEAIDSLKARSKDSDSTQKLINQYMMRNIDGGFLKKFGGDNIAEEEKNLIDRSLNTLNQGKESGKSRKSHRLPGKDVQPKMFS